jgi:hypothetical protein
MKTKITFLTLLLCSILSGQVFAENSVQRLNGKPVMTQGRLFSKMLKGNAQVNKRQKAQLRADNAANAAQTAASSLRSSLEPGHNRPDSATYRTNYGYEDKSVFSYKGDTIVETTYRKGHYVYDPVEDSYNWEDTDTWDTKDYYKEEYVFDTNGNQTLNIYSSYSNNALEWADKEEYAYNANGTPLSVKYFFFEDGEWVLNFDEVYLYDANGMLIGGSITEYYEGIGTLYPLTVTGTVENFEISIVMGEMVVAKYVRHYDPATMKELASESYYLSEEGVMEFEESYEYTYDPAGRLIKVFENSYNEYYYITEYTYNANGQILSITESEADSPDGPYTLYWKTEYQYSDNRLIKIEEIDYEDGRNEIFATTTFYYSGDTGIMSPEKTALKIYASDGYLTFDLPVQTADAMLQLIDLTGRTVSKTQTVSGKPVAIPSLRGGVYIYRILAGSATYNGKIIIK